MDSSLTANPIRILAIDDHQHILDIIQDIFKADGYIIECERSAVAAWRRLQDEPFFDVVLLDVMMPDMDGFTFLEKMQANPLTSGLHVIMFTAVAETSFKLRAFAAGAADYLVKPFEAQELIARVRTHARLNRAEQEVIESAHRFQLLAENSVDAIWQMDLALNFQYINPAIETILGFPVSEWLQTNLRDHCPAETWQDFSNQLQMACDRPRDQLLINCEAILFAKDRQPVPVEIRGKLILDAHGRPQGVQGILRDISAQKAEERSRNQLAAVVEQAQETVIITNTAGDIVYTNPFFEKSSGYSRQEVQGKNPRFLKSGRQDNQFYKAMWETITAGEVWHGRFTNKRADGATYHEEATIFPIRDDKGQIINYAAVKRDITAQIAAEEALNRSLKTYSALFEQSQDGIVLIDLQGRHQSMNPAAERLLGYSTVELQGKSFKHILVNEEKVAGQQIYQRLLSGEIIPPYVRRFRTKNGEIIPVEITAMLVHDEQGRPLMIQSIMRDMREKYRAQQALQKYAKRLHVQHSIDQEILSSQPITQMMTRGLKLLHELIPCRQLNINLFDVNQQQMKVFTIISRGEALTPVNNAYSISINFEQEYWSSQKFKYIPDLAQQPARSPMLEDLHAHGVQSVAMFPMVAGREILGLLVMADNEKEVFSAEHFEIAAEVAPQFALAMQQARYRQQIQEHTQMLEARVAQRTHDLRLANAELARAARMKDEFLANMSHELRTPLSAILGKAEVLQEGIYGTLTEKQHRAAAMIEDSGRHLLTLINDILDIAKIEAGKFELVFAPISVLELCQSCINLLKQPANRKQLQINLEQDERIPQFVADGRRLKQALANLLSNAVKFTPDGGQIGLRVTCGEEPLQISFHVWDTGIGIPAEKIDRLFRPFVQLDSSLSREHDGTGLGLSLVQKLVDLHEGSLTLTSTPGEGSEFTIRLPLQTGEEPDLPENSAFSWMKLQKGRQRPFKLLLIEEKPQAGRLAPEFWSRRGCDVYAAAINQETLLQLRERQPDMVIIDLCPDHKKGLQLVSEVRQSPAGAQIPILATTTTEPAADHARCQAAGADDYLPGPLDPQQYLQQMITLLRVHQEKTK